MNTTWKEFKKNPLTHSWAHYLMAIQKIHQEQGYTRLSDVAKQLNISKGSLSTSLKPLIHKKLVIQDDNKHLSLSEKGETLASNIKNTFSVASCFLQKILNIDPKTAKEDACKIEHLLSKESTNELLRFTKVLLNNPQILDLIRQELHNYSNCSLKGCRICSKNKFCFQNKSNI